MTQTNKFENIFGDFPVKGFSRTGNGNTFHEDAALGNEYAGVSDADLIGKFFAGDDQGFAALLDRHLSMVYKFVYRYVQNGDDANDVVQEVFIKTWKHLASFDTKRNFKTWILTIAKNTALDFLKKKRPVLFSKIEDGENDIDAFLAPYMEAAPTPHDILEQKYAKENLAAAMAELTPAYRTVLSLRYQSHLKFREIAAMLKEPIDTVKSKHRRGLIALKKQFGRS